MKTKPMPVTTLETIPAYSFYRPHDRAATWFTNEVVNPVTGEVSQMPSMTKQSFVAQCDINNILKAFKVTGQVTHLAAARARYEDLPEGLDFQDALNSVISAQAAFAGLPSNVRTRFGNDPALYLEFMADPSNEPEAIALGLATKRAIDASKGPQAPSTPPAPPKEPEGSKTAPAG